MKRTRPISVPKIGLTASKKTKFMRMLNEMRLYAMTNDFRFFF